ncbi:ALQxL family class IV lanthipeptide [Micromonospora sp. NPDC023956]
MELDVNALQLLEEVESETALWPCTVTCEISCEIRTI